MICIGYTAEQKDEAVTRYCADNRIQRIFVMSPARFKPTFTAPAEYVEWADIIRYRFYYRLLQEIDGSTLIVVNECLRTQNRYDLTYNCIRNYLNQTTHQLVFQYLPVIDTIEDFMVLFDFDTKSRWKREKFRPDLLVEARIQVTPVTIELRPVHVPVDTKTRAAYAREREALLAGVRDDPEKDPHVIPRNLLLVSGKAKLAHVDSAKRLVGRNNRFKLGNLETYREVDGPGERAVFEWCHNFIDFADFLAVSRQTTVDALVADTKTEAWYLQRFQDWTQRVRDAQAVLQR